MIGDARRFPISGLIQAAIGCLPALAQAPPDEEAAMLAQMKAVLAAKVTIGTGTSTTLLKVPAVATVITEEDIREMGAADLDEALAMVPGLYVSHSGATYAPRYFIRGIASRFNPEVLVLVNGVSISTLLRADRGFVGFRFPAEAIARIEVIRGPGSAVFGADAYAGVINIITKSPEDLDGTRASAGAGTFQSRTAWIQHGGEWGKLKTALVLSWHQTQGPRDTLEADAQTGFDRLAPAPDVSLAPGPVNRQGHFWDLHLEAGYDKWRFRLGHEERHDFGTGQGIANALDPIGRTGARRTLADLSYEAPNWTEAWALEGHLNFFRSTLVNERLWHLFPAGAFFGTFPQGFIGAPGSAERQTRLTLAGIYSGLPQHRLRVGGGVGLGEFYRATESKNFDAKFKPLPGGLTDVTGTSATYLPEKDRRTYHAFLQDEWALAPNWELTAGLRYDYYSDFGGTTNPRAALVWTATPTLTVKALYGRAFRAPSFYELYQRNNPVTAGNPSVGPEIIHTTELAFTWVPSPWVKLDLNLYQFRAEDFIEFKKDAGATTASARNTGRLKGDGFEAGVTVTPNTRFKLIIHGSTQNAKDESTGKPVGEAPKSQGYARADWRIGEGWRANAQARWVDTRERPATDPRPPLKGYTSVDLALRKDRLFLRNLSVSLSVHNLFDADIREPSQSPSAGAPFVDIPNDLPQAGRDLRVEVGWRFN